MDTIQKFGYEYLKSIGGVLVARQIDLAGKLDLGDSFLMVHGSNGVIYFLISDLINYLSSKGSKLLTGNINGILDDSVFFGGMSAVTEVSNVDKMVYDLLQQNIIRDTKTLEIAIDSGILTGGRILASYVDSTANAPSWLKSVRHPTLLFRK